MSVIANEEKTNIYTILYHAVNRGFNHINTNFKTLKLSI